MYSIKENSIWKLEIKNSKFICYLFRINNKDEFNEILNNIKGKYKDATHYCYGYVTKDSQKASDDGEPGGTAGMPILNVINSNNLINTGAIVIRYFGGIKLGAGGLVRAYTKVVNEAIKNNTLVELINGINITIEFDYNNLKEIDYILKDSVILDKKFDNNIIYSVNTTDDVLDNLKSKVNKYVINDKIYIEKQAK